MKQTKKNEATKTKRKREVDQEGNLNLKTTRESARKNNYHRVVRSTNPPPGDEDNSKPDTGTQIPDAQKRLESVKHSIQSLPKDLYLHLMDCGKRLLSDTIMIIHFLSYLHE